MVSCSIAATVRSDTPHRADMYAARDDTSAGFLVQLPASWALSQQFFRNLSVYDSLGAA